jgi:hypothetical protein
MAITGHPTISIPTMPPKPSRIAPTNIASISVQISRGYHQVLVNLPPGVPKKCLVTIGEANIGKPMCFPYENHLKLLDF